MSRKALVAWEKVWQPGAARFPNIIALGKWNKAAILKHLWAISMKKDSLWIKCVHYYYIKNRDLETLITPKTAAWVVRKIIDSRKLLLHVNNDPGTLVQEMSKLEKHGKF
ncbi:hypothetical protein KY290_036363 [Solanum tuberosum]|uniref:Uncharacterized protein n=1 Tax=Solanum tuberosum TaxID=4113 RepID=A0ABQ7TUF0_SOLTU|nr:hypothetical protein KY290_036363 [Solanum tuberosum]